MERKIQLEQLLLDEDLKNLDDFAFQYAFHEAKYLKIPTQGPPFKRLCLFRKKYFTDILYETLFNSKWGNPFKYKIEKIIYITEDEIKKNIEGAYKNEKKLKKKFVDETKKVKNKLELIAFGDWHLGHHTCQVDKIKMMIDYVKRTANARVILMGDLMESATKTSVGSGPYAENYHPQQQKEIILELLKPIKDKIYGSHIGNHEMRILNSTSINLTKDIARELGHKYYGFGAYTKIKLGKQQYVIYSTHGSSGSLLPHTKIKGCLNLGNFIDSDVYLYGHVHALDSKALYFEQIKGRQIIKRKRYFILTGHYLGYKNSYAEMKNMIPSKTGSPKIKFHKKIRDIRVST